MHFTEKGMLLDRKRDECLRRVGIRILRIENEDVFENLQGVLFRIKENLTTPSSAWAESTPPWKGGELEKTRARIDKDKKDFPS
jgi:hypothetical protein